MKAQLDNVTLMELEAQLVINYHATFLSVEIKNDAIEIILCSSFFNDMDVKNRINHVFEHLKEEFFELTESYAIIVQCYDDYELNDILEESVQ